jgi:glycosyltransferase involved in cell wall biosynthesis
VLPSIAEGLSVAMLEALASGVPALMSNVGGTGQVIEHGHNGWLTEPDDVPALRDALITLLGDPCALAAHGPAGATDRGGEVHPRRRLSAACRALPAGGHLRRSG